MSLDLVNLSILASSGNPTQQAYAKVRSSVRSRLPDPQLTPPPLSNPPSKAIIPVRKNGHQLLTTLLLVNMIVNEVSRLII